MGADLLLTGIIHKKDKTLDWKAGRDVVKKMPIDTIRTRLEEIHDTYPESASEARRAANAIISDLKREFTDSSFRDAVVWQLPGNYTLHIRGGTSWGDSPSEGWSAFADAWAFPEAMKAIGFVVQG